MIFNLKKIKNLWIEWNEINSKSKDIAFYKSFIFIVMIIWIVLNTCRQAVVSHFLKQIIQKNDKMIVISTWIFLHFLLTVWRCTFMLEFTKFFHHFDLNNVVATWKPRQQSLTRALPKWTWNFNVPGQNCVL